MKNQTQTTVSAGIQALVTGVGIVVFYLVAQSAITAWNTNKAQALRNQAVTECAQVSQFFTIEKTDDQENTKTVSTKPSDEVYTSCLKDKGYQPSK